MRSEKEILHDIQTCKNSECNCNDMPKGTCCINCKDMKKRDCGCALIRELYDYLNVQEILSSPDITMYRRVPD